MEDFAAFVIRRMDALGLNRDALGEAMGVTGQMVGKYQEENRWPGNPDKFARLCEALRLPFRTPEEASRSYAIKGLKSSRGRNQNADPFERVLRDYKKLKRGQDAESLLVRLLSVCTGRHAVVVTTQTNRPAALRPADRPEHVTASYAAMGNGLLMAFVVPTAERVHRLESVYHFDREHLIPHASYLEYFAAFRDGYATHLARGAPGTQVEDRLRLFQYQEFPMTPCGRVVTMFTQSSGTGHTDDVIIERGLGDNGPVTMQQHSPSFQRMRSYVLKVMRDDGGSPFAAAFERRLRGE